MSGSPSEATVELVDSSSSSLEVLCCLTVSFLYIKKRLFFAPSLSLVRGRRHRK